MQYREDSLEEVKSQLEDIETKLKELLYHWRMILSINAAVEKARGAHKAALDQRFENSGIQHFGSTDLAEELNSLPHRQGVVLNDWWTSRPVPHNS